MDNSTPPIDTATAPTMPVAKKRVHLPDAPTSLKRTFISTSPPRSISNTPAAQRWSGDSLSKASISSSDTSHTSVRFSDFLKELLGGEDTEDECELPQFQDKSKMSRSGTSPRRVSMPKIMASPPSPNHPSTSKTLPTGKEVPEILHQKETSSSSSSPELPKMPKMYTFQPPRPLSPPTSSLSPPPNPPAASTPTPTPTSSTSAKSVHWHSEKTIYDVSNTKYGIATSSRESMSAHFQSAPPEVQNALDYLSWPMLCHIAAHLPPPTSSIFSEVAFEFQNPYSNSGLDSHEEDNDKTHTNEADPDETESESGSEIESEARPRLTSTELKSLKKALLDFLAELHPHFIFCQDCEAVHHLDDRRVTAANCLTEVKFESLSNSRSTFNFKDYQHELKKARLGIPGRGFNLLKSLRREDVKHIEPGFCVLECWDPFISEVGGYRLVVRAQKWMVVPEVVADKGMVFMRAMEEWEVCEGNVLCRHKWFLYDWEDMFDWQTESVKPGFEVLTKCDECALEFVVEKKEIAGIGSAVVVTSWRDLGRCVSVHDRRFRAHFEELDRIEYEEEWKRDRPWRHVCIEDCAEDCDESEEDMDVDDQRGWSEDEEGAARGQSDGSIKALFDDGDEGGDGMDKEEFKAVLKMKANTLTRPY